MRALTVLFLGFDSFVACAALGPLVLARSRWRLAALFGVADAIGFVTGALVGWRLPEQLTGSARSLLVAAYGAYVLVVVTASRRSPARWPVWALPWVLAIDNLSYGVASRPSAAVAGSATLQAVVTAALAFVGLTLAILLRRTRPRVANGVAGGGLLIGAALLLVT